MLAEAIARAGPGYGRWTEQVAATGYCAHPVRLRGTVEHADAATGEVLTVYDSDREPDATLLKACGNRRASVCPSCSSAHQADSFQLLAAGLRGGKGVPDTVAAHPRLGEPLCARCYQAGAQVLWNAPAGRLWSRTTIYVYRALAQLVGLSEGELRGLVRVSFAKVAEFQRRGAVHFHAVIRLDAATDCACPACVTSPPAGLTAELLEAAVRQAAATVSLPCPAFDEDQGVTLDHRIGEVELEGLDVPAHVAELVRACWELGAPVRVWLGCACGSVRAGELAALPVGRLDFLRGACEVLESATEVDNKLVWGVTKPYERRTVRPPRFLCEQVGAYLADRPHAPDDLVFTMLHGGPLREPKFAERYFKPAARAAGLPVHDLRRTCASLLIREGASIKAVQHHLGHKSTSITLDRYGHLFPEELDHLADRLDRLHAQAGVYPACTDDSVAALGDGKGPGR